MRRLLICLPLALSACPAPEPASPAVATSTPTLPPSATPTLTPSFEVAPSAPAAFTPLTLVSGMVYDEAGHGVEDASVRVTSLEASWPYQFTARTGKGAYAGSYAVNSVPFGTPLEFVASKEGWTSRRRVGTFVDASTLGNVVDFGGPNGSAYFISDRPEIAAATLTPTQLELELSEPLGATNRDRLAATLRVAPEASTDAVASGAALIWDGTFTHATWPLHLDPARRYQACMVGGPAAITDDQGHALGTGNPGEILQDVFHVEPQEAQAPANRWRWTHQATVSSR
jgi:hypothetical protein